MKNSINNNYMDERQVGDLVIPPIFEESASIQSLHSHPHPNKPFFPRNSAATPYAHEFSQAEKMRVFLMVGGGNTGEFLTLSMII